MASLASARFLVRQNMAPSRPRARSPDLLPPQAEAVRLRGGTEGLSTRMSTTRCCIRTSSALTSISALPKKEGRAGEVAALMMRV